MVVLKLKLKQEAITTIGLLEFLALAQEALCQSV